MNLKTIIIDDELNSIDVLKILLGKYCPDISVSGTATTIDEGIRLINDYSPNIVFLDIEMPPGSGFDVLHKINKQGLNIIFVTAYDQYALKAIKHSALDYLLKPVDIEELIDSVQKVTARVQAGISYDAFNILKNHFQKERTGNRIAIPTAEGMEFVCVQDIIRLEASGNYTKMFLMNKKHYLISRTLKDYEELLMTFNFLRVHNAHVISLSHIEKYIKGEGGYAIMADGSVVDISKRKKQDFLARFSSGV